LTDEAKDEAAKAKEQAGQAGHQAKAAAKSGGRALKHVASDVADKAEDVAQEVAQEAVSVAHRLRIAAPDLALATFGLAVTVYAGRNAIAKFQAASGQPPLVPYRGPRG
jgi:F0F1-type ATP synthase membrane subunit b/b'